MTDDKREALGVIAFALALLALGSFMIAFYYATSVVWKPNPCVEYCKTAQTGNFNPYSFKTFPECDGGMVVINGIDKKNEKDTHCCVKKEDWFKPC